MSMAEEMYGGYELPNYIYNEDHWKAGVHYDSNDNPHLLRDMSDSHLLATINYFKHWDTSPLQAELDKRNNKC